MNGMRFFLASTRRPWRDLARKQVDQNHRVSRAAQLLVEGACGVLATAIGFTGVMIVVAPELSGSGGGSHPLMPASAPVFAVSFPLTRAMNRHESPGVILAWQSTRVSIIRLPLALCQWESPSPGQWVGFVLCGCLGGAAHCCLTRSVAAAAISATQSAKFLDLLWSAPMGWLLFTAVPSLSALLGGVAICAATIWAAQRESHGTRQPVGDAGMAGGT
jgi:drug/metabolite transporter (DMT)-like permease